MTQLRLLVPVLAVVAFLPTAFAGPFKSKPRPDETRVLTLLEMLKSDPDEKKRRAAADELGGARQIPEVAAGLSTALQKDASASVRAEAARSLGQLDQVFPLAGVALEAAAAGDSSPLVRLAAKQTLWEYHLNGYRSPKATEGVTAQTVEPPIAAPGGTRPVVALIPAPPPPTALLIPTVPSSPTAVLPPVAPPAQSAPAPTAPMVGPRIFRQPLLADLVSNLRPARPTPTPGPPPILNMTGEPPVARRPAVTIPSLPPAAPAVPVPPPTPAVTVAPMPLPPMPQKPDYVPTLPPFQPDLPSVVLPPDATPFVPPPAPRIPATLPTPK